MLWDMFLLIINQTKDVGVNHKWRLFLINRCLDFYGDPNSFSMQNSFMKYLVAQLNILHHYFFYH